MKNFCWRAAKAARPLQTCSLRERLATLRLVFKTRKSRLCAARTAALEIGQIMLISLLLAIWGGFADHLGAKISKIRVGHLFRRGCLLGKARPKESVWCGLSAPKAFVRPRMVGPIRPPLTFPIDFQQICQNLASFRLWLATDARYRKISVEIVISGPSSP